MEKKINRIGSVGLGSIWNGVHAPGIQRSPNLELVAICDIDEEKLQAALSVIRQSERSNLHGKQSRSDL